MTFYIALFKIYRYKLSNVIVYKKVYMIQYKRVIPFQKKFMSYFRILFPRLGKQLFFDFMTKKKGLFQRINEINLLVLGSSHAKVGFNTCMVRNSFNLGTDNQDLYTSYKLLKSYIPNMENLKTVVLFYSLFSSGFDLAKTKSYRDICLHHYIFDIPYTSNCVKRYKNAYKHRLRKFDDSMINYKTFSGYTPIDTVAQQNETMVKNRVAHHLRENQRTPSQHKYLDQILRLCKDRNVSLSLVVAPLRKDFIDVLRSENYSIDDLFKDVYLWSKKNKISIKNYLCIISI